MIPSVGELVAGKYRVERVLGSGGMGIVVVAMHVALEQRVALKLLRPDVVPNEETKARFAREARAAARIESEHVARVLDVTTTREGAPVLVMEYLEGCDLEQLLEARGALPVDLAVGYVLQACEAIAEAHAAGIVHRDLKPANLFLANRADGSRILKVLDFGISKFLSPERGRRDAAVTSTRAVLGSPLYMAPEQLASTRDVDERADLWSLVVVLFELIDGSPPFDGETVPVVTTRILTQPAPSIAARRRDVPTALDAVVRRGLEKRPDRRFADVAELARALAPFAPPESAGSIGRISRLLHAAPRVAGDDAPSSVPSIPSIPTLSSTIRRSRAPSLKLARGRTFVFVGALAAAASGALFVSSVTRPPAAPSAAARPPSIAREAPPAPVAAPPIARLDAGAAAPAVDRRRPRAKPTPPPDPAGTAGFGGRR